MHLFLEYGKMYRGYRRKQRKIQKRFTFLFAERRKDRQGMNCKECEKFIPAFIAGELIRIWRAFLHMWKAARIVKKSSPSRY